MDFAMTENGEKVSFLVFQQFTSNFYIQSFKDLFFSDSLRQNIFVANISINDSSILEMVENRRRPTSLDLDELINQAAGEALHKTIDKVMYGPMTIGLHALTSG
jgi:ABC-type transport system involved in cytochrome bd biosynthesis fused ATPase/permease subunit